MVSEFIVGKLHDEAGPQLWVRINPLDGEHALADLATIVPAAPSGIMIPKITGPEDVRRVDHYLEALETSHGLVTGSIRLLPVATETPIAPFRLGDFAAAAISRLYGLTWGAEDLSAALGASTNLGPDGRWATTYQMVRSLMLMGAHAAAIEAVETLYVDIRDDAGLAESSRRARAEASAGASRSIPPRSIRSMRRSHRQKRRSSMRTAWSMRSPPTWERCAGRKDARHAASRPGAQGHCTCRAGRLSRSGPQVF